VQVEQAPDIGGFEVGGIAVERIAAVVVDFRTDVIISRDSQLLIASSTVF